MAVICSQSNGYEQFNGEVVSSRLVIVFMLQDCKMELNDEEGHRCYPLNGHLLCHSCHLKHIEPGSSSPIAASYQL